MFVLYVTVLLPVGIKDDDDDDNRVNTIVIEVSFLLSFFDAVGWAAGRASGL